MTHSISWIATQPFRFILDSSSVAFAILRRSVLPGPLSGPSLSHSLVAIDLLLLIEQVTTIAFIRTKLWLEPVTLPRLEQLSLVKKEIKVLQLIVGYQREASLSKLVRYFDSSVRLEPVLLFNLLELPSKLLHWQQLEQLMQVHVNYFGTERLIAIHYCLQ